MKLAHLNEQGEVYSEAHARELLAAQVDYNKKLQDLNNELAKVKSEINLKHMKLAQQQQQQAATKEKAAQISTSQQQTGTVNTAGTPVTSTGGTPAPTVESYSDILKMKIITEKDDEEIRFSGRPDHSQDYRNWYEKPEAQAGYEEPKSKRKKRLTPKQKERLEDISYEIEDLENEIKYTMEKFHTPTFSGVQGEIENFFGEVGFEAADILNSGLPDEQKLESLDKLGIEKPKEILQTYYYYYPEFDESLDKERKEAEKHVKELESKIEKLEKEFEKLESLDESLNETSFNTTNANREELNRLIDYFDAEDISYYFDEDGDTIDFDETELDKEWQDQLDEIGLKEKGSDEDTSDILSIEDDEDEMHDRDEIDEKKIFYVKVEDEGEAFIGKIYKLFDDGDWRSKIVDGESETFEKLNYDPDWDEIDIVSFLRDNYADADIIDEDEFSEHAENPEFEPEESEEVEESWSSVARAAKPILKKAAKSAIAAGAAEIGKDVGQKIRKKIDKWTEEDDEDDEELEESFKDEDDAEEERAYSTTKVPTFKYDKKSKKYIPYSEEDYEKQRNERIAKWKAKHKNENEESLLEWYVVVDYDTPRDYTRPKPKRHYLEKWGEDIEHIKFTTDKDKAYAFENQKRADLVASIVDARYFRQLNTCKVVESANSKTKIEESNKHTIPTLNDYMNKRKDG